MSLLQYGDNDIGLVLKLGFHAPFSEVGTHFKDWAVASTVINFYNYLALTKEVSVISLPQISTDLENCHIAFLYIFFSKQGLSCDFWGYLTPVFELSFQNWLFRLYIYYQFVWDQTRESYIG